jgi:hypothetical protein
VAAGPAGAAHVGARSTGTHRAAPVEADVHEVITDRGPAASWGGPSAFPAGPPSRVGTPEGTTQQESASAAGGRSSTGRAPVSKTGGWGFDSLRPCAPWKVPRAPDPRPGREISKQRGTGLTVTRPWGHLSRPRPQRRGVGAKSIVDSIRQEPDPHCGSGILSPQRPTTETSGMPALRHMRRLGNMAGPPGCRPGPSRACRFESCPAHLLACGGTSRWPATAAVSKTEGPHGRASSILAPSAVGRRRRGGLAPGCYPGRGPAHEVRLLHLPPGSVGPVRSGRPPVEREITGSSPVRSAIAVVAAGCQSGLSIRAARVRSPSTAHDAPPPWSSGQGRPVLSREDAGSSPAGGTDCSRGGTGRRTAFK